MGFDRVSHGNRIPAIFQGGCVDISASSVPAIWRVSSVVSS